MWRAYKVDTENIKFEHIFEVKSRRSRYTLIQDDLTVHGGCVHLYKFTAAMCSSCNINLQNSHHSTLNIISTDYGRYHCTRSAPESNREDFNFHK